MSELEANRRYWWSKVRQALSVGSCGTAVCCIMAAERETEGLGDILAVRVSDTFRAGLAVLGDPAPLDKEQDNG